MLHVQPISTLLGPQIPQLNVFYLIMVREVLHEFPGHVSVHINQANLIKTHL
jgi:hypothetical protein